MRNKTLPGSTGAYRLPQPITCLKADPTQWFNFFEDKRPVTPLTPAKLLARHFRKG